MGLSMGSVIWRRRRRSYGWLLRACVIAVVLIGHIGLLMMMLRPAIPRDEESVAVVPNEHDSVQVRLVHRMPAKPPASIPEHPVATVSRSSAPVQRAAHTVQPSNSIIPAPASPDQTPWMPSPETSTANPPGTYVAGGHSFQQNLDAADHPFEEKVPGGYQPRAPRFKMTDPRAQGVGGVVRWVRHFFRQMVDPRCVDVNTWLGMSPAEQAKHASPSEIKQIAEEYGCVELERFPNTAH